MKILLRYLFPIILAIVACIFFLGESDSSLCVENQAEIVTSGGSSHSIDSPISYSHLNLPRQISGANNIYIHSTSKRTNNLHKSNFRFVKVGKEINANIRNFIQKESLNIHYSFIKPVNRLIGLGKLII